MSSTITRASLSAILLIVATAKLCSADLFLATMSSRDVLRIDSTTGAITRTYTFPDFVPIGASIRSMAFDGRLLYMTRPSGGITNQLLRLDVVNNIWLPPQLLDTVTLSETPFAILTGLGVRQGEFGFNTLIGVSLNNPATPPSHLFRYDLFPPDFPDPFFLYPNTNFPPPPLPPGMHVQGGDVDPETGDFWVVADQTNGQGMVIGRPIMRVDDNGNILETITPDFGIPVAVRGLGFDRGSLFVAGRELLPPDMSSNKILEIDRSTGAVLNSFQLPGMGIGLPPVGGLTGGEVIPEPTAAVLAIFAMSFLANTVRTRRC
jgi:hypothetical protein